MDTIYLEQAVADHPRSLQILKRFPNARRIVIERYADFFNRKAQNFRAQKQNPALVLAAKHKNHVLEAPADYHIGGRHNYYFSHMMNCIYDCRYCFLQGMYSSANYVVFVNFEDFFTAIDQQQKQHTDPTWFFSGYDCDSLALEPVTGFIDNTLNFFSQQEQAHLEIRTKSTQIRSLLRREPVANCVVAYSFTPAAIADKLEHKTPSVEKRLQALVRLQEQGWNIGLRLDPLIRAENFHELYAELLNTLFDRLDCSRIHSVSLGPFRLPKPFFKKLIQLYPDEPMLADKFSTRDNMVSYSADEEQEMIGWCSEKILQRISDEQFFPCVDTPEQPSVSNHQPS
ncbi:MAG: DNA photolyase [Gammaproteobacteria bacterium]|nr:DNA photolyase [Gammaproteobacteria bacterium]